MPTVEFCIDPFHDALTLWGMLHFADPAGRENRMASMNLPKDVGDKFINAEEFKEIEKFATKYLEKRHTEVADQIQKAKETYQIEWNKINDHLFKNIKGITGYDWAHKEYFVVVSPIHKGVSTMGGNTVVRSAFEDSKDQLRITAHELLMSHIWTVLWIIYPESKKDTDMKFWAINELITNAILGLDPAFKDLWTKKTRGYDQYLRNYPQLEEAKMELKAQYAATSFEGFLAKTYKRVMKGSAL